MASHVTNRFIEGSRREGGRERKRNRSREKERGGGKVGERENNAIMQPESI